MGEFIINGSSNHEPVQMGQGLLYKPTFQLPYSRLTVIQPGQDNFLFQNYTGKYFQIWLSEYQVTKSLKIYATVEQPLLELSFILGNEMNHKMEGMGDIRMPGSSFNLSHEPYVENQLFLQKGKSVTFDVHISKAYLQLFCQRLPALDPFINQISKGAFALLCREARPLSPCIQAMINAILHVGEDYSTGPFYLESLVDALLLRALSELIEQRPVPLKSSAHQAEAITGIERYLTEHFDEHKKIDELAQLFAINEFTMKQLFKEKYGVGVYEFLRDRRMDKASLWLINTKMPIREMAFTLGYRNPNCLTEAFKKKFGMTPLQYRLRS